MTDDERRFSPTRRPLRLFLVLGAVLGVLTTIVVINARRPEPTRVLIAIDVGGTWWAGSAASGKAAARLAARLRKLGFDAIGPLDPTHNKVLDPALSPEVAGKKLRASFVVTGKLEPVVEAHASGGGDVQSHVEGIVHLAHRGDPAHAIGRVSVWADGKSADVALDALAERIADASFDVCLPALVAEPSVTEMLSGRDLALKARLEAAQRFASLRQMKLEAAQRAYSSLAERRLQAEQGAPKPSYQGAFNRAIALAGVGPQGPLLKVTDWRLSVSPDTGELEFEDEHDRLVAIGASGEHDLYRAFKLRGYPTASLDAAGGPVSVAIEDLGGSAEAVTAIDPSGVRRIRIERERELRDPKLSPDGRLIALWLHACKGCPAGVWVVATADGKERLRTAPERAVLGGFAWLGPTRLAFVERPTTDEAETQTAHGARERRTESEPSVREPRAQRLIVADLSDPAPKLETLYTTSHESLAAPSASRDGRSIVFSRRAEDGKELALFDVEERKLELYEVSGVSDPVLSPNGDAVAFEHLGDIALVELSGGKLHELTKNPFVERYPAFSADGRRVLFESRDEDPNHPGRVVSVLASVPLR